MLKINNSEVDKVQVYGGNIINYPLNSLFSSGYTNNGITYTSQASGAVLVNGTATADSYANLALTEPYPHGIPSGTYTISGCPNISGVSLVLADRSTSEIIAGNNYSGQISVTDSSIIPIISIRVAVGTVLENIEIKPMFNIGGTALPFKTYFEKQVSKVVVKQGESETTIYEKA